jgi:hypothetical protein
VRCRSPSLQSPTHYYIEPLYIVVAGHAAMVTPCREPSRAAPGTILNWLWTGASQPRPNHQGNKRHPCRSWRTIRQAVSSITNAGHTGAISHRKGARGPVVHFIISAERWRRNKLRSLVRYGLGRDDP